MIDWLTIVAPLRQTEGKPPLNDGMTTRFNRDGEEIYRYANQLRIDGSHDGNLYTIARGDGKLHVSGNPSKYLQGHNIFGPECVNETAFRMAMIAAEQLGIEPTTEDLDDWRFGKIELKRIDITYSTALRSRAQVIALIKQMEFTTTFRHRGTGTLTKGSTLYFGKHSRRWSMKFYSKGQEINAAGHRLPRRIEQSQLGQQLIQHADPLLRAELTLRTMELKRKSLDLARNWTIPTLRRTHHEYMKNMTMSNAIIDIDEKVKSLPQRLRMVAKLHLEGFDTRNEMPRATWYRRRKELLAHGIDLADNIGQGRKARQIEYIDEEPIVVRFNYTNQVPDFVHGTELDPQNYVTGNWDQNRYVPQDIAQTYPEHFSEDLAYRESVNEEQLDLFH